jgi:hypothetical protein
MRLSKALASDGAAVIGAAWALTRLNGRGLVAIVAALG